MFPGKTIDTEQETSSLLLILRIFPWSQRFRFDLRLQEDELRKFACESCPFYPFHLSCCCRACKFLAYRSFSLGVYNFRHRKLGFTAPLYRPFRLQENNYFPKFDSSLQFFLHSVTPPNDSTPFMCTFVSLTLHHIVCASVRL